MRSAKVRKYNYFEKNGRFYRVRAPQDKSTLEKKTISSRARRFNYFEKNGRFYRVCAPRARPSAYRRHPRQQAPGNERPHPDPLYDRSRKSRICLPYLEDYEDYSSWVEISRRRRSRHHQTSVSPHTKKHTPRHAPAAPSAGVDERSSSIPTHQLPSSLTSLPVRTRHPPVNVDSNDDCGKNLHGINPSAPAAQEDQVKLHESGDATPPLQDETNIESGSGISDTGLMTLEERFEGLEVGRSATDERPTSLEFALATEVEGNLRNGDLSDGEDIE